MRLRYERNERANGTLAVSDQDHHEESGLLRETRCDVFLQPNYVRFELALLDALTFRPGEPFDWVAAVRRVAV